MLAGGTFLHAPRAIFMEVSRLAAVRINLPFNGLLVSSQVIFLRCVLYSGHGDTLIQLLCLRPGLFHCGKLYYPAVLLEPRQARAELASRRPVAYNTVHLNPSSLSCI